MVNEGRSQFSRKLWVELPDFPPKEGVILFDLINYGSEWRCEYELTGAFGEADFFFRAKDRIIGDDGIQAMQLCFHHLHMLFEDFENCCGGLVWWTDKGDFGRLIDASRHFD
jgi:hypothetical protein